MSKLIFSSILMSLFFTGFSHASERLASFYLDSEVILNSGARSLDVKVVDVRAVKSAISAVFSPRRWTCQLPSIMRMISAGTEINVGHNKGLNFIFLSWVSTKPNFMHKGHKIWTYCHISYIKQLSKVYGLS